MEDLNDSPEDEKRGESKTLVKVKEDPEADTIKDYAENTMNELLGLFGYEDKINSTDTENLNLDSYTESKENEADGGPDCSNSEDKQKSAARIKTSLRKRVLPSDVHSLARQHMNLVTALKLREKSEKKEVQLHKVDPGDQEACLQCAWCKKPGNNQFTLDTPTGSKIFCSEVCFDQCRRASFKKSKICDWCKHVRHTVNYVEFQDGETQLQFCSEKCLNQYKMSIFCKETQEHLHKLSEKGEDNSDDKETEKEILITPELWLRDESSRRAAEARENARERARNEKRQNRDHYRKTVLSGNKSSGEKQDGLNPSDDDGPRHSYVVKIKNEPNMRYRRSLLSKERESELSNQTHSEDKNKPSPSASVGTAVPHNLVHPALAGMSPWIHQSPFLGPLGQAISPFPGIPPMMLTGFVPPFVTGVVPPVSPTQSERGSTERDKRDTKKESLYQRLHSPHSERSSLSDSSSHVELPNNSQPASSPGLNDRRTSSLFPVDFPNMFQNHGFPGPHMQSPLAGMSGVRPPGMVNPSGIPPVTVMMPFPVVLPLPVPIPVPIPLTLDTLTKHFKGKPDSKTSPREDFMSSQVLSDRVKGSRSPRTVTLNSPHSIASSSEYDRDDCRTVSRNSLPDMSYGRSDSRVSVIDSFSYKRSRTPDEITSLDLTKHAKVPKYSYRSFSPNETDGVIDLSATRENGNRSDDTCSENGGIKSVADEKDIRDRNDNLTEDAAGVPKIHIITHKEDDVPLNQPLPLPPTENPYSTRRGLILDAPSVPKKSRSPSPERRIYVRNVPRDIIEAARRRCMRTRIRTK